MVSNLMAAIREEIREQIMPNIKVSGGVSDSSGHRAIDSGCCQVYNLK